MSQYRDYGSTDTTAAHTAAYIHDPVHALPGAPSGPVLDVGYGNSALPSHVAQCLKPGGLLALSTPYHGYFKNLLLARTGKLDAHFPVLWDGGHIQLFSRRRLESLLRHENFTPTTSRG